jgi:large subunit ribosomal protein L30
VGPEDPLQERPERSQPFYPCRSAFSTPRYRLELAAKVCNGEIDLRTLWSHFKPYFRLHPPKGGLKRSVKRFFGDKGEAGYRGLAINDLVIRMV